MLTVDMSNCALCVCVFRTMLTEYKSNCVSVCVCVCVCVEGRYALPAADWCMLY